MANSLQYADTGATAPRFVERRKAPHNRTLVQDLNFSTRRQVLASIAGMMQEMPASDNGRCWDLFFAISRDLAHAHELGAISIGERNRGLDWLTACLLQEQ